MIIKFLSNLYIALPSTPLTDAVQVERYSWDIMGGPSTLTASAPITVDKWQAFSLLRAPVEVYDEDSKIVWWGYVSKITIPDGAVKFSLDVNGMYNSIAVSYTTIGTSDTPSVQEFTAWATDALSVEDYGSIEKILGLNDATATSAAALRDNTLARNKYPVLTTEFGTGTRVQIECSGWWSTLNWQYYSSTDTSNVDTMTQVKNIITAEGQFITGVSIDGITSGITSPAYREPTDRQKTAQAEVETLLAIGNTGGKRYMANVLPARTVVIEPEPDQDARYLINADGQLEFLSGGIVPPSRCIVGAWVAVKNAPQISFAMSAIRPVFIERAEYSASSGKTSFQFAGTRDPLKITEIV